MENGLMYEEASFVSMWSNRTRSPDIPKPSSPGRLVFIKGQGSDQSVIEMNSNGTLSFADLDESAGSGQGFFRESHKMKDGLCDTFESRDYSGRFLWADSTDEGFTVYGKIVTNSRERASALWKVRHYSQVTGNIEHYRVMKPGRPWYCLQFWGDVRYRSSNIKKGLFLVASAKGSSATFTLGSYKENISVFSF